jgi:diguanylate cyclase (GGDEF)-like protein
VPRFLAVVDPDGTCAWHWRGVSHFAFAMASLLSAAVVTHTATPEVISTLATGCVVVGGLFLLLMRSALGSRRPTLLLSPAATIVMLGVFGSVTRPAATLMIGLVVLAFLFIGLSQPPWTSVTMLVPAVAVYKYVVDLPFAEETLRGVVAALVWILVAEIPSRLVKDLRDKQAQLETLAVTDSLTGAFNRTRLDAELERTGPDGVVVLIDIDHFKEYNDTHGHVAGDGVLREFAEALAGNQRRGDSVVRYGGEEFLMILQHIDAADAFRLVERIADLWSRHPSGLTFSAGVAPSGPDCVHQADLLLYRAKGEGRARISIGG